MVAIDSVEARKRSKEVREGWLQKIADGEIGIDEVIEYSRGSDRDSGYIAGLRLSTILTTLPGWSDAAVTSVLIKEGFKQSDTLRTLRSYNIRAGKFKRVFELPPPSFASTRPAMPTGWPWQGKLADLVRATGKNIPAIEVEGVGTGETPERKSPNLGVPGMRANPRTGELLDPKPFWESKPVEVPVQPAEPLVTDNDIADLFGENADNNRVDESDIEAFLS